MSDTTRLNRTRVEISALRDQGADALITDASPAELMAMVWQLTLDVWTFKDASVAKLQFQRHAVRVVRGGR